MIVSLVNVCQPGNSLEWFEGDHLKCHGHAIQEIVKSGICELYEPELDLEDMTVKFPLMTQLVIRSGNTSITHFNGAFPPSILEILILTDLELSHIEPGTFNNLVHLKTLDLSRNLLQELDPRLIVALHPRIEVYLSGMLNHKCRLRCVRLDKFTFS